MTGDSNYYTLLGVAPHASQEIIREAFATLLGEVPDNSPRFAEIKHAYEVLSDSDRRAVYDSLLQETAADPLTVSIITSRQSLPLTNAPQRFYLLAKLTPEQADEPARPLNLCLVLDRSTSMQGKRLTAVKTAVDLLVEKMSSRDRLTIVGFSDRAQVIYTPDQEIDPRQVSAKVRHMRASGGTEIFQGLTTGFQTMQTVKLDQYVNQIILLTDGHTYGDEEECLHLAHKADRRQVGITAFGLGSEWNDAFLDKLVAPSGSKSEYIDAPEQIVSFLQERIQGLGALFAENVKLDATLPEAITLNGAHKLEPFSQPLEVADDIMPLGHMESASPLTILLELTLAPQPAERRMVVPLTFTAEMPTQPRQTVTFKKRVTLSVLKDADKTEPHPEIVAAVRNLNLYRLNEKVWADAAEGNIDKATQRMGHLTTRLLEAGETKLAEQAQIELQRLNHGQDLSEEGHKRLKYGTRALNQPAPPSDKT